MSIKKRGFASLSKERLKEVSTSGGKRAHELGVAYKFTHETAILAGRKGKRKPGK